MNINPERFAEACRKAIDKGICAANCCGPIPMPKETYERVKGLALAKHEAFEDDSDQEVYVVNSEDSLKCVFLKPDCSCAIYEDRPEVCRNYGTAPDLECPYIKPNGNLRSPAQNKHVQRKINQKIDWTMKKIGQKITKN
jgi:Fe-S-cluster containining protein